MKKVLVSAIVASGLVVGVNALDFGELGKSIGKGLETAQNAGVVKTGIPTDKQFKAKIVENAKKNIEECKTFYNKEKRIYADIEDSLIEKDEIEIAKDYLGEWDRRERKVLSPFSFKALQKAAKDDKDKIKATCYVVLNEGLTKKEQKAFHKETYEKFNIGTGTELRKK